MSHATRPLCSILVKPAGPDCNMACSYCFYRRKRTLFDGPCRMTPQVLEAMTRQLLQQGEDAVSVIWQGGEPTLMDLPFYERALELQESYRRPGQHISNGLMTNGLLIDERWCELLRRGQFLVGLSIDGPRDLHDHYRHGSEDEPSHERVVRSAKLLLEHGVEVNALALATDRSCHRGGEIYETLTALGLRHLQVVPCVDFTSGDEMAPHSVTPEGYGQLLCDLFDCWIADFEEGFPTTFIRWFEAVFHRYVGYPPTECTLDETCGGYVVVEHQGDVYCCDFFVDRDHCLGNLLQQPLAELLQGERQRAFGASKAELAEACVACRWLPVCTGGCLKDRRPDRGGVSYLCEAYQRFFEHADPELRALAARWRAEQSVG